MRSSVIPSEDEMCTKVAVRETAARFPMGDPRYVRESENVVNKGVTACRPAGHCLYCCCYANPIDEDAFSHRRCEGLKGVCRLSKFAERQQ